MAQAEWAAEGPAQYAKGRVPVAAIMKTAVSLVAASWPRAWPAWLALTVVGADSSVAISLVPKSAGLVGRVSNDLLLFVQAALVVTPVAAAYRALLGEPRLWALDGAWRRFAATSLGVTGALFGWLALIGPVQAWSGDARLSLVLILSWFLVMLGLLCVAIMLSLWPVAMLMNNPKAGSARAWRQMKGAALSLSIAMVVLCAGAAALPIAVTQILANALHLGGLAEAFAQNLSVALAQWMVIATTAAVWRLRNGRGEGVAAVFD